MIDSKLRKTYDKHLIDPLIRLRLMQKMRPQFLTILGLLIGIGRCKVDQPERK